MANWAVRWSPILPSLVRCALRRAPSRQLAGGGVELGPLNGATDWSTALEGVSCVVHCASLTWVAPDDPAPESFHEANAVAAENLARQAAAAGVKRIVYVSSVSVNGKHSGAAPFRADDPSNPQSVYSESKRDAEDALHRVSADTGIEVVIVRPPRILWPEPGGNVATLAALVRKGVPLPFGSLTRNARDNVSAHNLISLIERCIDAPAAAGQTYLVSDGTPFSTRDFLIEIGRMVGRKPRLIPVPEAVLRTAMALVPKPLLGKLSVGALFEELTCDLQLDIEPARRDLGWQPQPRAVAGGKAVG